MYNHDQAAEALVRFTLSIKMKSRKPKCEGIPAHNGIGTPRTLSKVVRGEFVFMQN